MASLLSRRAPLGDLSNSLKTGIPHDASKKKGISKASGKAKTASRKALSDISNTGRSFNGRESQKSNQSLNTRKQISELIDEPMEFHNHQKCLEAQSRDTAFDIHIDELLQPPGLRKDCSEKLATPFSPSPLSSRFGLFPLQEMPEQLFGEERGKLRFDSPSPFRTPELDRDWNDCVNFKLIESPEFATP